jgi:hypothetical protein
MPTAFFSRLVWSGTPLSNCANGVRRSFEAPLITNLNLLNFTSRPLLAIVSF